MEEKLRRRLDGLLEKYTELLLGETNPDVKEEVRQWILYTHIAKKHASARQTLESILPGRQRGHQSRDTAY